MTHSPWKFYPSKARALRESLERALSQKQRSICASRAYPKPKANPVKRSQTNMVIPETVTLDEHLKIPGTQDSEDVPGDSQAPS